MPAGKRTYGKKFGQSGVEYVSFKVEDKDKAPL